MCVYQRLTCDAKKFATDTRFSANLTSQDAKKSRTTEIEIEIEMGKEREKEKEKKALSSVLQMIFKIQSFSMNNVFFSSKGMFLIRRKEKKLKVSFEWTI